MTSSTMSYVPLDSDAPAVFKESWTNNYLQVAFLTMLLYDHTITLDMEIQWIWTLRWRLPKIVFVFNRYVITGLLLLQSIPNFIFPLPLSFCSFYNRLYPWLPLLNFGATEVLLIIRVCALYGHRKLLVWSVGSFFVLALAGAIVSQALFIRTWQTILYYEFLPGCWLEDTISTNNGWYAWAMTLSVECVLVLLTAYKLFSYRNQMNWTVTVLARDSIAYFFIIFACLVCNLTSYAGGNIPVDLLIPTECICSIAVGRMMMNIRGLILDDPEHTVHLQTLQFVERTNDAGSEFEDAVEARYRVQ